MAIEEDPLLQLPEGVLRGPDGKPVTIPPDGALGLLALGWEGLRLWRDQREEGGWKPAIPLSKPEEKGEQDADGVEKT